MAELCATDKKNLGVVKCNKLPQMPRGTITTSEDFKLTPSDLATPAALQTALQAALVAGVASRAYLWPFFVNFEDNSEEAIYSETALSDITVRDGKYRWRFHIQKNLCMHKAMFTHRANGGRVFLIDIEGNLVGTEDADGNMYGFLISNLNTEKLRLSNGADPTVSPIYLVLADNKELDKNGVMVEVSAFINTLKRLTDVEMTQEAAPASDASNVYVKIATECDGTPVNGLVIGDFVVEDAAGDPVVLTTVTETGDGIYRLQSAAAFANDDVVSLISPATLSVKAYELLEELTVVIP